MKLIFRLTLVAALVFPALLTAEDPLSAARVTGNIQLDGMYYMKDSVAGTKEVPEDFLSNSYLFVNYSLGSFSAGFRYEAYMNPMLGFDSEYKGNGFAYRYASFQSDFIDVTAGNFYEQFGSGMIFRAYEERQLGVDNSMDGARVRIRPVTGIDITGIVGKQRSYWDLSAGVVRGGDINLQVNDVFTELLPDNLQLKLGASVVSKYQSDQESNYNLPENVLAWSARCNLSGDIFNVEAEYAYKNMDPNATNGYSFNPGHGLLLSGSLFGEGIGFNLNFHGIDNMDYRSNRDVKGFNKNMMNYIPALTKMQGYSLTNVYPYATQLNGEVGLQAELTYTFPKKSWIGGEYGMTVNANYSRVQSIDTTAGDKELTYNSTWYNPMDIFSSDRRLFFQEMSLELNRKISTDFKTKLTLIYDIYDKDYLEEGGTPTYGQVQSFASVFEFTLKTGNKQALRMEFQHLLAEPDSTLTKEDNTNGNWLGILAEYTFAPNWFFTVADEYNYGNDFESKRLHYYNFSAAYIINSTRIALSYSRQREGLLCVGGICRVVPAANGVSFSITSSF